MTDLTDRQREILDFIVEYFKENLIAPSYQQIADEFGLNSKNGISDHIKFISNKGWLIIPRHRYSRVGFTKKCKDAYGLYLSDIDSEKYRRIVDAVLELIDEGIENPNLGFGDCSAEAEVFLSSGVSFAFRKVREIVDEILGEE